MMSEFKYWQTEVNLGMVCHVATKRHLIAPVVPYLMQGKQQICRRSPDCNISVKNGAALAVAPGVDLVGLQLGHSCQKKTTCQVVPRRLTRWDDVPNE